MRNIDMPLLPGRAGVREATSQRYDVSGAPSVEVDE